MKFYFFYIALFLSPLIFSQNSSNIPTLTPMRGINVNQGGLSGSGLKYNDGSYINEKSADVKGQPFLFDEWKKGSVLLKTKEKVDSVLIKYNLYTDLLLVKVDEQEYQFNIDVQEFLIYHEVSNENLLFRSGYTPVPGMTEKSFYQVLYDGKTKLLLKHKKIITEELTSTPGVKAKVYEERPAYYILTAGGKMEKMKKKGDSILNILGDKKKELTKMAEANNLKMTVDADLVKLLEYYDQISR
ncbi:hypothetical protein [Terrimonas pollutisoli]|uniref:hypothetical protein n=1 Tax=Terrimonas pollutisoli TaxID=3034147 RepID=UPI0023EE1FAA|nr:hypothetical protein [Terrimonas sp. H1YJ31]